MTIEHYLIGRLAEVMHSAGNKANVGEAVGCAIRNRVQSLGISWYDAITQETAHLPANPFDRVFLQCLWTAENIFYGREYDTTAGSTHWTLEPRSDSVAIGGVYFFTAS